MRGRWHMCYGSVLSIIIMYFLSSIVSGHMDGYLHVVGLDGYRRHTLSVYTSVTFETDETVLFIERCP